MNKKVPNDNINNDSITIKNHTYQNINLPGNKKTCTVQKPDPTSTVKKKGSILRLKIKDNKIEKIMKKKVLHKSMEKNNKRITLPTCMIKKNSDNQSNIDEGMTMTNSKNGMTSEKVIKTRWEIPNNFASSADDTKLNFNNKHDLTYGKKPTIAQLATRPGFGRPSKNHSFTSDKTFDHVLIHILKSKYLDKKTLKNVEKVHPLYKHLNKTITRVIKIDFSDISKPDYNYREQTEVSEDSVQKFLSAAIYYDFHLGSVMRYAGNNYTTNHLDARQIISRLEGIVPTVTLEFLNKRSTDENKRSLHKRNFSGIQKLWQSSFCATKA